MINRYILALLAAIFSSLFFCGLVMAKQDTAQITLKKTATSKQKLYTYTVKKGDMISFIVRHIPNINEKDISNNYKLIKNLNPNISNLNKLYEGQLLILPGEPLSEQGQTRIESKIEKNTVSAAASSAKPAEGDTYIIQNGDTLIKIIYRRLKAKENARQMFKVIQLLNPSIVDINRIYVGQTIKLPAQEVFVKAAEEEKVVVQEVVKQAERPKQPEIKNELKEKILLPPEAPTSLAKPIITQTITDYNRAIELNLQQAKAYFDRGVANGKLGNNKLAIEDYNKAIELNPQYVDAYYNRGIANYNLGKYQLAIEDYNRTIELNPQYAKAFYNRGIAHYNLGKYQQAIEDYNKAIELNPQLAEAYIGRGVSNDNLGKYQRAIENYNKAIELNPQLADAYNNRGVAYQKLGNNKRAIENYKNAAKLGHKGSQDFLKANDIAQ